MTTTPLEEPSARERFHDRVISVLLAAIWMLGATFVWQSNADIPVSMLAIATVFFLMLVPAMKELVKILDRWVRAELGLNQPQDDQ
jgi:hypothetical protein